MKNSQSQNQVQTDKVMFTQEEVNQIIRKRLKREGQNQSADLETTVLNIKITVKVTK